MLINGSPGRPSGRYCRQLCCIWPILCSHCSRRVTQIWLAVILDSLLLILGVCTPLIVLCDAFSVITSAVSFQGWSSDCGFCVTLFFLVCFVCTAEIFMPRVFSLQSLTLGTSAPLWIIWSGVPSILLAIICHVACMCAHMSPVVSHIHFQFTSHCLT